VTVSVRTKFVACILNEFERMTGGSRAWIGVDDRDGLMIVLEAAKSRFGDRGRVLEIENMCASPKSQNPEYRVTLLAVRGMWKNVPAPSNYSRQRDELPSLPTRSTTRS
jgi:hypothetical protein